MALVAVIAVITALLLMAIALLVRTQRGSVRIDRRVTCDLADHEAESLFNLVGLFLVRGTAESEARAAERGDPGPHTSPGFDGPVEFEVPLALVETLGANSSRGRIRDVRIEAEQGKINLHSASPALVAGLDVAGVLKKPLRRDNTDLTLVETSDFPGDGGLVRVGSELVRYTSRQGNVLTGLRRGVRGGTPWHSPPRIWRRGTLVCPAAAWEVATWFLRARPGEIERYPTPECARQIAGLGTTALDRDGFERIAGFLTCWSGGVVGSEWCNAQRLLCSLDRGLATEENPPALRLSNPRYFGSGTIVRITGGRHVEYGMVESNDGVTVQLVNGLRHDYEAGKATVDALARHPVNVNTAPEEVLVACLSNLCLRADPGDVVTEKEARDLAARIREKPIERLFQFEELLARACEEGIISAADHRAIYLNALNPCDRHLAVSTAPLGFRSFDTVTVHVTAALCSKSGEELARQTFSRVVSVQPGRTAEWSLDRQTEFEEH
ncbi:MAG: hypothetical protein ABFS86_19145, partial [Planctomycetota bacterium]